MFLIGVSYKPYCVYQIPVQQSLFWQILENGLALFVPGEYRLADSCKAMSDLSEYDFSTNSAPLAFFRGILIWGNTNLINRMHNTQVCTNHCSIRKKEGNTYKCDNCANCDYDNCDCDNCDCDNCDNCENCDCDNCDNCDNIDQL